MYYFLKCGDTTKEIPFEVVERYEHHTLLRSVIYPSRFGMSRPYYESALPHEMAIPRSASDVIRWVENSVDYKRYLLGASKDDEGCKTILKEWAEVKRGL